jgi:hypothetical protein
LDFRFEGNNLDLWLKSNGMSNWIWGNILNDCLCCNISGNWFWLSCDADSWCNLWNNFNTSYSTAAVGRYITDGSTVID